MPRWYLLAEEDRMVSAATQAFMADRMDDEVRSHRLDHMPLITDPDAVVSIIIEAMQSVRTESCPIRSRARRGPAGRNGV